MERRLRRAEKFDEIGKLRVAAGIATAADGDAVEIPGFCLEGGKGFLCDGPQILETRILLPDTFGTIVAACFERHAVAAAERPGRFHAFKITVLAEAPAVYARPSPDIHGQLSHSLLDYSVPVRIMCLELNGCGTGKNHCLCWGEISQRRCGFSQKNGEPVHYILLYEEISGRAPHFLPVTAYCIWRLSGLAGRAADL